VVEGISIISQYSHEVSITQIALKGKKSIQMGTRRANRGKMKMEEWNHSVDLNTSK
jgi:hypothetical protein